MSRPFTFHTCTMRGLRQLCAAKRSQCRKFTHLRRCEINPLTGNSAWPLSCRGERTHFSDWRDVARFQSGSIHFLPRVQAKWDSASRRWARLSLEFDYRVHRSFNPLRLLTMNNGTPMLSDSPPPGKQLD